MARRRLVAPEPHVPRPSPSAEQPVSRGKAAPHPADVRKAEVLANPAGYTASIRAAGRNNTIPGKTLAEVAVWAYGLEAAVAQGGGSTHATVYALPHDGGGHEIVPRAEWLAHVSAATQTTIDRNVAANIARMRAQGDIS